MPAPDSHVQILRKMIGDVGATGHFSQTELEAYLTRRGFRAVALLLSYVPPVRPNDTTYYTNLGNWNDAAVVKYLDGSAVTFVSEDKTAGVWHTHRNPESLYIDGIAYDLNGAAADALDDWSAYYATAYNVTLPGGGQFTRSQITSQLAERAASFRAKSWGNSVLLQRDDELNAVQEPPPWL